MAITETYVDPSIAADSGAGTVGDPYGDIQFALDSVTRDATNGDRINIKAGTDEILVAALSLATYGVPTLAASLVFQGYTTAAGDRGIGGISGNASVSVISDDALDFVSFIDMHLHNSGSSIIAHLDNNCNFLNCEVDNTDTSGISVDNAGIVDDCYIHNCGGFGVETRGLVSNSYFENGTNDFSAAIRMTGILSLSIFNIINIDGSSKGIEVGTEGGYYVVVNNSVFSSSGTGIGISARLAIITNNIVEGFSGIGGVGISASDFLYQYGFNAFYNNTTNLSLTQAFIGSSADDQILTSSPFIDAASQDFRVTTSVKALAYPTDNFPDLTVRTYLDIGALQRKSFPLVHPDMAGGIRG